MIELRRVDDSDREQVARFAESHDVANRSLAGAVRSGANHPVKFGFWHADRLIGVADVNFRAWVGNDREQYDFHEGEPAVEVCTLYLDPAHRGLGHGRQALQLIIGEAIRRARAVLFLRTMQSEGVEDRLAFIRAMGMVMVDAENLGFTMRITDHVTAQGPPHTSG